LDKKLVQKVRDLSTLPHFITQEISLQDKIHPEPFFHLMHHDIKLIKIPVIMLELWYFETKREFI
jgi:hypothetical protein